MDLARAGEALGRVLPRIRTQLQLSGFGVGLVCALAVHFAAPGNNVALLTAGGVGVSFLIFGQLFTVLDNFRPRDRAIVFLATFVVFCVFTLSMVGLTVMLLRTPVPELSVSPYSPPQTAAPDIARSDLRAQSVGNQSSTRTDSLVISASGGRAAQHASRTTEVSTTVIKATRTNAPRNVEYRYSEINGIATLRGMFQYLKDSRALRYPEADFHNDVSFGSPWLSLAVNNPGDINLLISSMELEAVSIKTVNDLILDVIVDTDRGPPVLVLTNAGWGSAIQSTLTMAFGVRVNDGEYRLISPWSPITLGDFSETARVELSPLLPKRELWEHHGAGEHQCDVVTVFGRLTYRDANGRLNTESFRTSTDVGYCAQGGNIPPRATFNVDFPLDLTMYPLNSDVSNCVAARSAGRFLLHMTSQRSAVFVLDVLLRATGNTVLRKRIDVEVLVPRDRGLMRIEPGASFSDGKTGCT